MEHIDFQTQPSQKSTPVPPKSKPAHRAWGLIGGGSVLIIALLVIWYLMPKTATLCGSALPMSCETCRCSWGILIPSIGSSRPFCLFGKLSGCVPADSHLGAPVMDGVALDEAEDWQTYRNEEYGFEVKYPSNWIVENNSDTSLSAKTKLDNDNELYLGISFNKNSDILRYSLKSAEEINIEGSKAYKYFFQEGVGTSGVIAMQLGKDVMQLELIYFASDGYNFNTKKVYIEKILYRILSTFKFTDKDNSSKSTFVITTFEQCVAAGNPIMESFPEKCRAQDGTVFTNWSGADLACIQVVTSAKNPQTGEVRDFPTPCDVPEGWETIK